MDRTKPTHNYNRSFVPLNPAAPNPEQTFRMREVYALEWIAGVLSEINLKLAKPEEKQS